VTEYEPNKKYSFKSLSGPLHSQTSYTFETANGGTIINISMQADVVNFFQINEGILEKSIKKQVKENLAMLKGLLEAKKISLASETNIFTNGNI
jgi:hypothetical protein